MILLGSAVIAGYSGKMGQQTEKAVPAVVEKVLK
jgi:hypothetical protein